jgi:Phage gp6-like head-tail connector protein
MATTNVPTLDELKAQLNVTDAADDTLITRLLAAAVAYVTGLCPDSFAVDATVPDPVKQATLMLGAFWFENRELGVYGTGTISTVPFGFDELIMDYRGWAF